jgi:MFS family permease
MTVNSEGITDIQAPSAARASLYPWYAVGVLMLAYVFSYLDRQILYLMVGPIRRDLHITDFEFSLLSGAAFGIFYTFMGLPIGWLADRWNRKKLMAAGIAAWSVMTALCGLAQSYGLLFLARVGVGVGESTLSPSAYSFLSDSFDKVRLPRAMSIYGLGLFIGAGVALIIGGQVIGAVETWGTVTLPLVGELHSWHLVFLIIGLPGLLVALWISTLREPARTGVAAGAQARLPFAEVFRFIAEKPLMAISLFLGAALFSAQAYADSWYPTLFMRLWGWKVQSAGQIVGASSLIAGPIGMLFAGWLSSRWIAQGKVDACLRITAWAALGITLPATLLPIAPNATAMALLLFPFKFFIGFTPVLIPSALQLVAPNQIRAQLGAMFLFCTGLIGVTGGPILPAFLSDYVFTGAYALPHALSVTAAIIGPSTFLVSWIGLGQYRDRYRAMHSTARLE